VNHPFPSLLFPFPRELKETPPACLVDLGLDRLFAQMLKGKEAYDLAAWCYTPLTDPQEVSFRHEILGDLDDPRLQEPLRRWSQGVQQLRSLLEQAERSRHRLQKERWQLDAAEIYVGLVSLLNEIFEATPPRSRGLRAWAASWGAYASSWAFRRFREEVTELQQAFARLRYGLHVRGSRVEIFRLEQEVDEGLRIAQTFAPFAREAKLCLQPKPRGPQLNALEERILDQVAALEPEPFCRLSLLLEEHKNWIEPGFWEGHCELQFYMSYLELIAPLRARGLPFCLPRWCKERPRVVRGFDLELALRGASVVPNDLELAPGERIFVVTGPNHAGKTTFLRMWGQLHYLAALGLPIPAQAASLVLLDRIETHFERQEDLGQGQSRLESELARMKEILDHAGPHTLVLLNESFASTSSEDALLIWRRVLGRLQAQGAWAACVTFLEDLAREAGVVSLVAEVDPRDPSLRTYRVRRGEPQGRAYAQAIADKYRLSAQHLKERLNARRSAGS